MSQWNSPARDALCTGEACPICQQGKPHNIIAELEATYLTASPKSPMRGYGCLVLKRHAVELYELAPEDAHAFTRDLQQAAYAIQQATGCVKLNYEIHGNTIPHLHVHLFPRYVGDPFEGGPINPRLITTSPYEAGAFEHFVHAVQNVLQVTTDTPNP